MHKELRKAQAMLRIEEVRRQFIAKGFRCLSGGKFGLPSYDNVSAWANGRVIVYLVTHEENGGWDILCQLDSTNSISATWAALANLVEADQAKDAV